MNSGSSSVSAEAVGGPPAAETGVMGGLLIALAMKLVSPSQPGICKNKTSSN